MTTAFRESSADVHSAECVVSVHRGGVPIVDELADEWRGLCEESENDQPFYRPEWIRAYIGAFIPGARVLILAARVKGRLCFLLPMVEEVGFFNGVPVRKLRNPVGTHGARFDAVSRSGPDGDAAISATWKLLQTLRGWDLLEFGYTPAGSTIDRLIAKARGEGFSTVHVAARPNPFVTVPAEPELLKQLPPNSKLRSQLRQARLRLAEQAPLNFYRLDTADRDALNRFYELEASGWKGRDGSAIACCLNTRQFYLEIAESAARFGYFSLYMLEWNGELLAAHFALTHQNKCFSPKVAYNERYKHFAPGHLIVSEILQDCSRRGIHGYDITGPADEWKMKWTSEARPVGHQYVFRGPLGSLAHTMTNRIRPTIGKLLRKKTESHMRKIQERNGFSTSPHPAHQRLPVSI